jgi:hypothetical protein
LCAFYPLPSIPLLLLLLLLLLIQEVAWIVCGCRPQFLTHYLAQQQLRTLLKVRVWACELKARKCKLGVGLVKSCVD